MHVTVASERLSLDNYATAPGTCGGAASSATRTSMHGVKPQRQRHFVFEKERSITAGITQMEENRVRPHIINAGNR